MSSSRPLIIPSILVAALCSKTEFVDTPGNMNKKPNERECLGDATETGILKCYETIMGDVAAVRKSNPEMVCIPFNSRNKFMV